MKKLIFLLLTAVILTGFVSATEIAYPPWDISLDAALSELGVDGPAVTSDTVLVDVSLYADQLAAGNIYFDYETAQVCGTGQANELNGVAGVLPDYPLLL
jgi:hypothetical protein